MADAIINIIKTLLITRDSVSAKTIWPGKNRITTAITQKSNDATNKNFTITLQFVLFYHKAFFLAKNLVS